MRLARYLTLRIAAMVVVLLVVTFITYLVFEAAPADPARLQCGHVCTASQVAQIKAFEGLNHSVFHQYVDYIAGIFSGRSYGSGGGAIHCGAPCLGYSFQQNKSVLSLIGETVPVTLSIAIGAAILWLVSGVFAGTVSALRHGGALDRTVMAGAIVGVSAPAYLVGLLAILVFGFRLGWFPTGNYVSISQPAQWAYHLVLPWFTLAFISAAIYARLTRSQMLDALDEDYVRTARAKGLRERRVITRHALRNVLIPVITVFGLDLGVLLGGAVITEKVFSMYGLGALLIGAVGTTDLPVITGVTVVAAAFVVVANFIVDLTYRVLDPRV